MKTKKKLKELENVITNFIKEEREFQEKMSLMETSLSDTKRLLKDSKKKLSKFVPDISNDIKKAEKEFLFIMSHTDVFPNRIEIGNGIENVQKYVENISYVMKELPNALQLYEQILIPQFLQLEQDYNEMVQEQYLFLGIDFDAKIKELQVEIENVETNILVFDIIGVETSGVYIRKLLDIAQVFLENEWATKKANGYSVELENKENDYVGNFIKEWISTEERYEKTVGEVPKAVSVGLNFRNTVELFKQQGHTTASKAEAIATKITETPEMKSEAIVIKIEKEEQIAEVSQTKKSAILPVEEEQIVETSKVEQHVHVVPKLEETANETKIDHEPVLEDESNNKSGIAVFLNRVWLRVKNYKKYVAGTLAIILILIFAIGFGGIHHHLSFLLPIMTLVK